MLVPVPDAAPDSKHILRDSNGARALWIWSGETWRLAEGVMDNTPDEMTAAGWTYVRAR